jgi:hypothetical protein
MGSVPRSYLDPLPAIDDYSQDTIQAVPSSDVRLWARLMLPVVCQLYVSSPGLLQRQKLPDVDGVAAKLETF